MGLSEAGREWRDVARDTLGRGAGVLFFCALLYREIPTLLRELADRDFRTDAFVHYAAIALRLTYIVFTAWIVWLYVVRHRPLAKTQGLWPRAIALLAMLTPLLLLFLPQRPLRPVIVALLLLTALLSYGLALAALGCLGRAFSILPEARRLVVCGPYALVRHPMYLAQFVMVATQLPACFSGSALAILAAHVALQIARIRYEEAILMQVFPEYAAYRARTSALISGVY